MVRKVPSYPHHKSDGRAVVTIAGRDYYLGKYNSKESKLAYDKLIREWRAAGQSTSFGHTGGGVTVAMLLADYIDHCEVHYPGSNNSEMVQSRNAIKYMEPYCLEDAEEFGPRKLKAVRQAMLDKISDKTGKPLSRASINKLIDRIVRAWRWASENELVPISVYHEFAVHYWVLPGCIATLRYVR